MKGCIQLLGMGHNRETRRKKYLEGASKDTEFRRISGVSISLDISLRSKNIFLRIVHAGGREERYQDAVPASQLMEKYPGMFVARIEVFTNPHKSLLHPEENLLPGQKYYIILSRTVQKLKHRYPEKAQVKEISEEEEWDSKIIIDAEVSMEESVCSAKEFYLSRERWSKCSKKKGIRNKTPFVPPLLKAKSFRGFPWEPSLTSVLELSP